MNSQGLILISILCLYFLSGYDGVHGLSDEHHHGHHKDRRHPDQPTIRRDLLGFKPHKLFVFGDSYADTGNIAKALASSWKVPYGVTFPGKPSGRFSDGRVSTDLFAKAMGLKSPIAYKWRNMGKEHLRYGMNFAFGGTGVFDTLAPLPNLTAQIDLFQNQLKQNVYNSFDLHYSVALVSVAGNDYSAYLARNGTAQGFQAFITRVVEQCTVDLRRLKSLGIRKVVVSALQPLGCLPGKTFETSFQKCNATDNLLVNFHNGLLQQAVAKLNMETNDHYAFSILDVYTAFMTVLKINGTKPESTLFENPLKPCCLGVSRDFSCGSLDANGTKKYTVCENPESAFFWDTLHPTQAGWRAVYSALRKNLQKLF